MKEIFNKINTIKSYLIATNILLVFFLILLSNLGVLPLRLGDFVFFTFLILALALYRPGWTFLFFIGTIALENINIAPSELGMSLRPYQFLGALTALALIIRFLAKRINFELPKLKWFDALPAIIVLGGFLSMLGVPDKIASLKLAVIVFSFLVLYFLVRIYIQSLEDIKRIIPFFLSSSVIVILYGIWQNIRFIYGGNSFEIMPGRPNATFTEADWLGIFLVFCLAVIYSVAVYFFNNIILETRHRNPFEGYGILFKKPVLVFSFIFITFCYLLITLTVSRSAWLAAFFTTVIFSFTGLFFPELKEKVFSFKSLNWRLDGIITLEIILPLALAGLILYFVPLTNFQLSNRAQSTGGLQKITISCWQKKCSENSCIEREMPPIENIKDVSELEKYGCRHINLEEIASEKSAGNLVTKIYRTDPNVNIRQQIYQKSWEQIKNNPILGIGWGSIGQILGTDERGSALNSSNIFLEVWLGSGIVGLLSFIIIWVMILISGLQKFMQENPESKIFGLFLIITVFALLIPNLFNAGIFLGIIWIFWGVSQIKFIQ